MDSNIQNVDTLITEIQNGLQPKYLFFWGHQPRRDGQISKTCLSQWFDSFLDINGVHYRTAEHYMMAEKARLFDDQDMLSKILASNHPGEAKKLGRQVRGYDDDLYRKHRFEIVVRGNRAKFSQNKALGTFLVNTKNRILVEASPYDKIWGIGLTENDPKATEPEQWDGLNLLGFALMEVREHLRK